jgi:hypothetical protein
VVVPLPGIAGMNVTTVGPLGAEPTTCMGAEVRMVMGMLRLGLLPAGTVGGSCTAGLLGTGGGSLYAWLAGGASCCATIASCLMVTAVVAVLGALTAGAMAVLKACGWGASVGAGCRSIDCRGGSTPAQVAWDAFESGGTGWRRGR